jgi:magnesium chelatase family protein
MLVGACNRCPCARPRDECVCNDVDRARYGRRLSGPLLDRIDLVCELDSAPPLGFARSWGDETSSAGVRERVVAARERQRRRLEGAHALVNAEMDARATRRYAPVEGSAKVRLLEGHARGSLTGRGHDRVLRIARTIADLDRRDRIRAEHVEEALGFRFGAEAAAA